MGGGSFGGKVVGSGGGGVGGGLDGSGGGDDGGGGATFSALIDNELNASESSGGLSADIGEKTSSEEMIDAEAEAPDITFFLFSIAPGFVLPRSDVID